jgi:serine/threonine protein phosphatase Stp1
MNILRSLHSRQSNRVEKAPDCSGPFETACRTHAGSRSLNEDRFLERSDLGLWAVADGMGGHERGDLAAQAIVDTLSSANPSSTPEIVAAVGAANASLFERANEAAISGSTVVILRIEGPNYEGLWAGDSELWLVRDGELRKLSRDHSVVEELVCAGLVPESERRTHPQAHLITRAVGASQSIELEHCSGSVLTGDVFLLCSDGLTKAVLSDELFELASMDPLGEIADRLLSSALEHGASDNVTMILVRVPSDAATTSTPQKDRK